MAGLIPANHVLMHAHIQEVDARDKRGHDEPGSGFLQERHMPITWTDDLSRIDWNELSALYRAAPLGDKAPADLKLVFGNSMFRTFAFEGGELVGAGRVLADGRDCAYVCDIAVRPTHQGQGLGKDIVAKLVRLSGGHHKIILYAVPGKESFYARLGFRRMRTAMAIFADAAAAARGYLEP